MIPLTEGFVLKVPCPVCLAGVGELCRFALLGSSALRGFHAARERAAREAGHS